MINYALRYHEGQGILDLAGDLTVLSTDKFKSIVHNLTERSSIMLNMDHVDFITSSGLNALLEVSYIARDRGQRVIILGAGSEIRDLIDYAGMYTHLVFAESPEEGKTKIELYT
jgi:anti-anti-sigma factor